MKYDNERDRNLYGYDAGQIVDGVVTWDSDQERFILVDEDGIGFDPMSVLKLLEGKKIRMTIISQESMEKMSKMYDDVQKNKNKQSS
jgi:predicted DNA-binding antitoxin AbrB/MazE fold protein